MSGLREQSDQICSVIQCSIKGSPEEFKKWRKSLGLSQKNAAEMLGLKIRIIQYYEKGKKGKKTINIPKYIQLACAALEIQNKINKI